MHPTSNIPTTEHMALLQQLAQQFAPQTQTAPHPAGWTPSLTQPVSQPQQDAPNPENVLLLFQRAMQTVNAQVSAPPPPVEAPAQVPGPQSAQLAETQKLLELLATGDPNLTQQLQVLLTSQSRDSPQAPGGLLADRQLDPSQSALALSRAGPGGSRPPELPIASRCVLFRCYGKFDLYISHPLTFSVRCFRKAT
eukprot:jgi/Botrbrau1/18279/Bobra.0179s0013.2